MSAEVASGPGRIRDVGDDDFEREVIERSNDVPVVVDFWAPWCGPCQALGPILEQLADEHAGAFVLAKVDVDQSPLVAQSFGVRSIPTVMGFRDGEVAASFVGAPPEASVRSFLAELLPSDADRAAEQALQLLAAGEVDPAGSLLIEALEAEPRNGRALLAMARVLARKDEIDAALDCVERVVPVGRLAAEKDHLAAELRMRRDGHADVEALREKLTADPESLDLRLALGRALAARGEHEEALRELLEIVKRDPQHEDGAARKVMVDLFEVLGADHALTEEFRPALARALYR